MNAPFHYGTLEVIEESFNYGLRQMLNPIPSVNTRNYCKIKILWNYKVIDWCSWIPSKDCVFKSINLKLSEVCQLL